MLALAACADAVYLVNQTGARMQLGTDDRADLDAGNLAGIRARYESLPPERRSAVQTALLCDVLLKYQELGRAETCLAELQNVLATDKVPGDEKLVRALPGKQALLALALGRPGEAARLTAQDQRPGGRYVFALASIRAGDSKIARPIADALRRAFDPGPVFYAAQIYAALGDFPAARAVLEDPARRLLADYGVSGHSDVFGNQVGTAVFRLDEFDAFDFGLVAKVTLAPAANVYVEYLAALSDLRTGDDRQAGQRLDTLLALPAIAYYRDVHWRALTDRADIALRAGDTATAERLLRQAIDIIETIRGSLGAEAARIAVITDKEAPYHRLIDLLEQRGDNQGALVYAERAHSRALVELLATQTRFGPPGEAASTANRLVEQYDRRQGEVQLAADRGSDNRAATLANLAQMRAQLISDVPDVADLVSVQPLDLAQVQHHLAAYEAALVFYPGESQWYAFTITQNRITAHRIAEAALVSQSLALRAAAQFPRADWQQASAALYHTAFAEALEGVDATSLVIVPSGVLHYVPLAALGEGDRVLVDRFAIRVIPNLGLVTRRARAAQTGHALVIGNPVRDDPKFSSLPFAEAEAHDVAALLGGATVLIGSEATVPRFLELAGSADLIHFAGHGQFDVDQPLDSGLMFAQPNRSGVMLRARDLYEMRSNASLAFLSACQTALGRTAAGQELIGLERGFFSAGVSSVIASLWEVHDESTALLAHEFYKTLKLGASPSRALQAAQLAVRHQYPQPVDWSGFILASVGSE